MPSHNGKARQSKLNFGPAATLWYAVRDGKDGSGVCRSWKECKRQIDGLGASSWRRFSSEEEAQAYLSSSSPSQSSSPASSSSSSSATAISQGSSTSSASASSGNHIQYERSVHVDRALGTQPGTLLFPCEGCPHEEPLGVESAAPSSVALSDEQLEVLHAVRDGESIFITGPAGTGKSMLLLAIVRGLRARYPQRGDVIVTAPTGIAASLLKGKTIQSWAGIGLGNLDVPALVAVIRLSEPRALAWEMVKVLVIDEISMVDAVLFDKLERIARLVRKSDKPFGGIQLVLTGDFFQLPPVAKKDAPPAKFAFEAEAWTRCQLREFGLTKVFRQSGDEVFIKILNEARIGALSSATAMSFHQLQRKRPISTSSGINPIELYALRSQVDKANTRRLESLPGPTRVFTAYDDRPMDSPLTLFQSTLQLNSNTIAPREVRLRVGAQVMLTRNLDETRVNGTLGTVVAFCKIPSRSSPHLGGPGQRLVRVLHPFDPNQRRGERERERELEWAVEAPEDGFPVVRFPDGRDLLLPPARFELESDDGALLAWRTQIPFILAYAISIHKAQGQTFEHVKVDLSKAFGHGMAYVALSRVTSLAGLQLSGFSPASLHLFDCDKRVVDFMKRLEQRPAARRTAKGTGEREALT